MQNKKHFFLLVAGILASAVFATSVYAQTGPGFGGRAGGRMQGQPGIFGTVSAINGTSLTVTGRAPQNAGTATTYTVDASNATVTKSGTNSSVSNIAVGDTIMVQGTISGTNVVAKTIRDGVNGAMGNRNGISGKVATINGTSLTVTGRASQKGGTATTYTVDASNATVNKNGASSSVSNIVVGDNVMVQGTVSGTTVTATAIRDGFAQGGQNTQQNPVIQGNGQPIVAGSVTAINGSTITITNKSNATYTVDASNAKVQKGNAISSLSSIAVGDNVVVQGTVNGTNIAAYSVTDQSKPASTSANGTAKSNGGFMGGIVNFFKHLFGF